MLALCNKENGKEKEVNSNTLFAKDKGQKGTTNEMLSLANKGTPQEELKSEMIALFI